MASSSSDSFDIQITFPEKSSEENKYVPAVLLLGWAGCQDKYLQKYSKIYEDKELITIRYSAPVSNVFWDKSGMRKTAEKIVKFIHDSKLEKHPLFLHIFSNGGAFLYEHVSLLLRKSETPICVKGVIFDSTPGERRIGSLFRVMQEIFGKTPVIGPILATIIFVILVCLYFLQLFYYKIKGTFVGYTPGSDPYSALLNDDTKYPHLLFYSKKDHLISYKDVDFFANYREKRGVKVTKICFEDSLHVKHYMAHPEVYKNCIQKFMDEALN